MAITTPIAIDAPLQRLYTFAMNAEQLEEKLLTLAILKALEMWSDPKYKQFSPQNKPGPLEKDWFERFVADWRVARTIRKRKRESVRRYLNGEFRSKLARGDGAGDVDKAAQFIKNQGWSAGKSKNGNGPLSLVSKIGFFLKPKKLVPFDQYARKGLKKLRALGEMGGDSRSESEYCDYLSAFNDQFKRVRWQIRGALTKPWVTAVAKKLGCRVELKSRPMERKVLDNYLMAIGQRDEERRSAHPLVSAP